MSIPALHRLLREWVVLVAMLAMVLGPLALVTSRSLAAQERVNIAAGLATLSICSPGDPIHDVSSKTGGGACDHCLPGALATPPSHGLISAALAFFASLQPADTAPSALLAQLGLPPATGPPAI
jgi:hypothetical protein